MLIMPDSCKWTNSFKQFTEMKQLKKGILRLFLCQNTDLHKHVFDYSYINMLFSGPNSLKSSVQDLIIVMDGCFFWKL